ncbi:hypothetical protein GQ457_07G009970 [Hibiscus cannabinus]
MSTSHSFSIRSAYESLVCSTWDVKSSCWKSFWSLLVPQRLRFFIWLSFKDRLMTNVERCRRSFGQSMICPCCHVDAETTVHALRDCRSANAIWSVLLPHACRADFFRTNLQDWLCSNLAVDLSHPSWDLNWSILFASTLWQIWCMRNNWVFNGVQESHESILHKSISWARYYSESCVFNERAQSDTGLNSPFHWQRLEGGWICLNTDGAASSSTSFGSVLQSELWAIFIGLQIARDNGFERLLVLSDNLEAVTRINDPFACSDVNALVLKYMF